MLLNPSIYDRKNVLRYDVLIVGGGLSGLTAAWHLCRHDVNVLLVESRYRLGGRILTRHMHGKPFDLGPSWIWPGQPHVARLLAEFQIPTFPQFSSGNLLRQSANGDVFRESQVSPMVGSMRVVGGLGALINALSKDIGPEHIRLDATMTSLRWTESDLIAHISGASRNDDVSAQQVVFAVPPRSVAHIQYSPTLSQETMQALQSVPTWMAGHAKFVAIYKAPFWRAAGLSGTALSRRGPLAEIHDASPEDGGPSALFGFVGLTCQARAALDTSSLTQLAIRQLVTLFGPEAAEPLDVLYYDWSTDHHTATPEDLQPLDHPPVYGLNVPLHAPWQQYLHFIGTETSFTNGGLVEGAISQATAFATMYLNKGSDVTDPSVPRAASMSWSWLD